MTNYRLLFAISALMSFLVSGVQAESPKEATGANADQTDNNYYWQGTQLYNLGRLGEAFESFEKAIQRKQNSKESEAYLLQIRQEIVNNAKKRSDERQTLSYAGNMPETAMNVTYVQKGYIRVTLQAKYLFEDNTTAVKAGTMDVINRLADLIEQKSGDSRIEINFVDELDNTLTAKDVDAERALMVFGLLNLKKISLPAAS